MSGISGKILSIDGGGIRGIIPAMVLSKIEEVTSKKVSELFDLVGGTSTGGILSLGLTIPNNTSDKKPKYTAQDMVSMYLNENNLIFGETNKNNKYIENTSNLPLGEQLSAVITNYKYNTPKDFFKKKFEEVKISSCLKDVVITTNEFENISKSLMRRISNSDKAQKNIHFFTKEGLMKITYTVEKSLTPNLTSLDTQSSKDFEMSFAATATSAAPGFFPWVIFENNHFFDGGILQNNPTLPCYYYAQNKVYGKNPFIVSLGTGLGTESSLIDFALDYIGAVNWEENAVEKLLTPGRVHRIQPLFKDKAPQLDDISTTTINDIKDVGKSVLDSLEDTGYLRSICKVLSPGL